LVPFRELSVGQTALVAEVGDPLAFFRLEMTAGVSFTIHARSLSLRLARR